MPRSSKKNRRVEWEEADDVRARVVFLLERVEVDWIKLENVHFYRSFGSTSRAYARIWGLPRVWQKALEEEPNYILEVISEKFDRLGQRSQDEVLLHEIAHIPRNFSGALLPHRRRGKGSFSGKLRGMINQYKRAKK